MNSLSKSLRDISKCQPLDLISEFWRLEGDAGLQRKLFVDFAENNPNAFSCFAEILAYRTEKVLRALAMQGLGQMPARNRPNYQGQDLESFLRILFAELRSSSDLLKWSASKVVSDIVPSFILGSRQFWGQSEPLDSTELSRIMRQMQSNYINKINYFDINKRGKQGDDPEYERYLEYWVYGDTSAIFTENSISVNYRPIIEHITSKLQEYGVILALGCQGQYITNRTAQDVSLRQARLTYSTDDNQKLIYDHLDWYIGTQVHTDSLRLHAAETLNRTGSWKPIIEKQKVLSRLLLGGQVLRDAAIEILWPQKSLLQQNLKDAESLLAVFVYLRDYKLDDYANLYKVSLTQIAKFIKVANDDLLSINKEFATGNQAAINLGRQLNCEATDAKQYIQSLKNQHINQIESWVKRLNDTSQNLRNNQGVIQSNQVTLNKVYDDIKKLDSNIYNNISAISDQTARSSQDYETLEKCKLLITQLEALRGLVESKLLTSSNLTSSNEATNLRERAKVTALCAVLVVVLTPLSGPSKMWLLDHPITDPSGSSTGSVRYGSSSDTQNSVESWYNTSFPKPNGCGRGTSINGQWYPVFVKYSASNWQGIISNHCGDIASAQSEEIASEKGQIQIASFGSIQEAEGFAAYMKSQYGSGWVGKN